MRSVVNVPHHLMKVVSSNWSINWGTQISGQDTGGGDQTVLAAFPRWIGSPVVAMNVRHIRAWQAIMDMAQGRTNALRIPMVERMRSPFDNLERGADVSEEITEENMTDRNPNEPRPTVATVGTTLAGSGSILVDERESIAPIPTGFILSHNDWPMRVKWRRAEGIYTRLGVSFVRREIPAGGAIDLLATGLFTLADPDRTFAEMTGDVATAQIPLIEWITRT